MENITRLPERQAEPEKITINLGHVDLGRIDLLVREGFYAQPDGFHPHRDPQPADQRGPFGRAIYRPLSSSKWDFDITRADLEAMATAGGKLPQGRRAGQVAADVTPELAEATIGSLNVLGSLQASKAG